MFPILFVTIACGAVSGFHSLVSSGTASKQIKNEKNMLPVSFGAMLMESMLAIIALIAVASFADGEAAAQGLTTQPQIFAGAIANFLSVVGLPHSLVFTLINLAVSAFALTSLDSVARVGRLSFQEFFMDSDTDEENMSPFLKVVTNKYFATSHHTGTRVPAYQGRLCRDLAVIRFCKPAVIGTCSCSLCSILKENQASGLDALGADGIHDGSYLYCT